MDSADLATLNAVSDQAMNNVSASRKSEAQLRKVANDFAGFFMGMMMKTMDNSAIKSDFGHGGKGEETFQSLAYDQIGAEAAQSQSYGLGDLIYQSLARRSGIVNQTKG